MADGTPGRTSGATPGRRSGATAPRPVRTVGDAELVLALDELCRDRTMELERGPLLAAARALARRLRARRRSGAVEGYYAEQPELTEYFRLVQALQAVEPARVREVQGIPEYELLRGFFTSGAQGTIVSDGFLPKLTHPIAEALHRLPPPAWSLERLIPLAREIARAGSDHSLEAIAAWVGEPVPIIAVSESLTLYEKEPSPRGGRYEYRWAVTAELAERAGRYVAALNRFVLAPLPDAVARNAELYWRAADRNMLVGQCVRMGEDPQAKKRHYHWAIAGSKRGPQAVEFWDKEVWGTAKFRGSRRARL